MRSTLYRHKMFCSKLFHFHCFLASIDVEYKKDLETEHNKLQNEIDEIKQLISTTETSALLLDNLQKDVESEVE